MMFECANAISFVRYVKYTMENYSAPRRGPLGGADL